MSAVGLPIVLAILSAIGLPIVLAILSAIGLPIVLAILSAIGLRTKHWNSLTSCYNCHFEEADCQATLVQIKILIWIGVLIDSSLIRVYTVQIYLCLYSCFCPYIHNHYFKRINFLNL